MAYTGKSWVQFELRELGSGIQLEFSDSVLSSKFLINLIFASMSSRKIYVPSPNCDLIVTVLTHIVYNIYTNKYSVDGSCCCC